MTFEGDSSKWKWTSPKWICLLETWIVVKLLLSSCYMGKLCSSRRAVKEVRGVTSLIIMTTHKLIVISLRWHCPVFHKSRSHLYPAQQIKSLPLLFSSFLWSSCSILHTLCRDFLQTVFWLLIFTLTTCKARLMRYDPVWTKVPVMFTQTLLAGEGHSHYRNKPADQGPALLDMLHSRRGFKEHLQTTQYAP